MKVCTHHGACHTKQCVRTKPNGMISLAVLAHHMVKFALFKLISMLYFLCSQYITQDVLLHCYVKYQSACDC